MNTAIATPKTTSTLLQQLQTTYNLPFLDLLFQAQQVHRQHHPQNVIQLATLANIKSGNCSEDCKYCPQSSRYNTGVWKRWIYPRPKKLKPKYKPPKPMAQAVFAWGQHG